MSEIGKEEHSRRYCTNCGAQVSREDAFCGSCGTWLSSEGASSSGTQQTAGAVGGLRDRALPVGSGRDIFLGVSLATGVAVATVVLIYLLLFFYKLFGELEIPYSLGLVLYALMHGGAVSLEVPPTQALLGIGGSLRLGLPISSFALFPFLALLLGARTLSSRARSLFPFAAVAIISYGLIVAVIALVGGASIEGGEGATLSLAAAPLSAGVWGLLWAFLGVTPSGWLPPEVHCYPIRCVR